MLCCFFADVSILLIGDGHDDVPAGSDLALSGSPQLDLWPVFHHRRAGQVIQPLCPSGPKHPGPERAFRKPSAVPDWAREVLMNIFTSHFKVRHYWWIEGKMN